MSSSDDANWRSEDAGEVSYSVELGVRKQSLRNIKPRSYSSLLKSESEEEEEEEGEKTAKSTVKPNLPAASKQGRFQILGCYKNNVFLSVETCVLNLFIIFGDPLPQDGGSVQDDPPAETVKHRRLFSRGTGSRPRAYKVKTSSRFSLLASVCYLITPGSTGIIGKCFLLVLVVCKTSR